MTAQVWREKCLRTRPRNRSFRGVTCSPEAKPVPSGAAGNAVAQDGVKPCKGKPFDVANQLELKVKKEIPFNNGLKPDIAQCRPKAEVMAVAHMTFHNPAVSLRQMRGLLKRRRKHLLHGGLMISAPM
jgi:hypothetical protein